MYLVLASFTTIFFFFYSKTFSLPSYLVFLLLILFYIKLNDNSISAQGLEPCIPSVRVGHTTDWAIFYPQHIHSLNFWLHLNLLQFSFHNSSHLWYLFLIPFAVHLLSYDWPNILISERTKKANKTSFIHRHAQRRVFCSTGESELIEISRTRRQMNGQHRTEMLRRREEILRTGGGTTWMVGDRTGL